MFRKGPNDCGSDASKRSKEPISHMEDVRLPVRILVIEDNLANLELMAYLLKAYGYELVSASNGEDGLKAALSEDPDIIICDVHLPRLDGYDVVSVLKEHPALRSIPVIAVTALAMVGDREKLLDAGFDGYISKPIDPETFIDEIGKFVPDKAKHPSSNEEKSPAGGRPPRFT